MYIHNMSRFHMMMNSGMCDVLIFASPSLPLVTYDMINIGQNDTIINTLMLLHPLTHDILNILMTIDQTECHEQHDILCLLP